MKSLMRWVALQALELVYIDSYKAIKVGSFKTSENEFYMLVCEVLTFIKDVDKIRYQRVNRELTWIVNTNFIQKDGARYYRNMDSCMVNVGNYKSEMNDIVYFANQIIHAATRAYIQSKGFNFSDKYRARIENICFSEQDRFVSRVREIYPDVSVRKLQYLDFSTSHKKSKWNTFLDDIKRILRS